MHSLILEIIRLAVWLLLLCAIFVPLERLAGIERQAFYRAGFLTDIGYFMLNSILVGMVLGIPLIILGGVVHQFIPSGVLRAISTLPGWARLLLGLVVGEFGFYWGHRFTHQSPFLWRFHAVHHSAKDVDFLTNTRAHPVDMVFPRLWALFPSSLSA
jgi:sterol desaturase/sphingolipid hydroxylase (fatty acid hydroxylase superfamily)